MRILTIFFIFLYISSTLASLIELNQTTFTEYVLNHETSLAENWFITFYAPWCEHCKKLDPILHDLSISLDHQHEMDTTSPHIMVGKIDATKNRAIANQYGIDKFPRILYKKQNLTGIYDGPRTLHGFQLFLNRFNDPIYQTVIIPEKGSGGGGGGEGEEEEEEEVGVEGEEGFQLPFIHPYHNVTFVLQVFCNLHENNQGGTNHKEEQVACSPITRTIFASFEAVATQLHLHTTFAVVYHPSSSLVVPLSSKEKKKKVIKPEITFCKFASSNIPYGQDSFGNDDYEILTNEDQLYCLDLTPWTQRTQQQPAPSTEGTKDEEIEHSLTTFIQSNNYPLINIFENHNFKILSHLNKTMILAVIDARKAVATKHILTQLKNDYLQIIHDTPDKTDSIHQHYILGYLDGKVWSSFVRHHDAFVPSILIIDHQDERHAVMRLPSSAKATERYTVLIKKVLISLLVDETIEMTETIPPGIIRKIVHRFKKYFPYSMLLLLLPTILMIVSFRLFPYPERKKVKKN